MYIFPSLGKSQIMLFLRLNAEWGGGGEGPLQADAGCVVVSGSIPLRPNSSLQ